MKILALTYGHPEAHGALISSILSISENANCVDFYYKNNFNITYKFPNNIRFIPNDNKIIPEHILFKSNKIYKFLHFLKFTFKYISLRNKDYYDIIFIIDPIALTNVFKCKL